MTLFMLRINRKFLAGVVGIILAFSSFVSSQTTERSGQANSVKRELNMLVLGDSILWGEGLKTEHKSWYQVKTWLEANTGRVVVERIEAHAGAVIESGSVDDSRTATNGDVNVALPTVNEELDNAIRFYSDRSTVDLVLISACGNDVGVQNLLNASGSEMPRSSSPETWRTDSARPPCRRSSAMSRSPCSIGRPAEERCASC